MHVLVGLPLTARTSAGEEGDPITTLHPGEVGMLTAGPQEVDGVRWWYMSSGAFGWLPETVDGQPALQPFAEGELLAMIDAATTRLADDPSDLAALTERGMAYYELKKYHPSIDDFSAALELAPDEGWLYEQRGRAYLDDGDYQSALAAFEQAAELLPDSPMTLLRLGLAHDRLGNHAEAIRIYQTALDINPAYGLLYNNLGGAYQHQGNIDSALGAYQLASQYDPYLGTALRNLATIYADSGQFSEALGLYDSAIDINPYDPDFFTARGSFFAEHLGDYSLALADFDTAIDLDAEYGRAYRERGVMFLVMGDLDNAYTDLLWAVTLSPNDAGAHYQYAYVLARRDDFEGALEHYTQALERGDRSSAYLYRAQVNLALGNLAAAKNDLDTFLAWVNDDTRNHHFVLTALIVRGNVQAQMGDYAAALDDYRAAFNRDADSAWNYGTVLSGYRVVFDQTSRIGALVDVVQAKPDDVAMWLELAWTQLEIGRWDDALTTLEEAAALPGAAEDLATFAEGLRVILDK
jgi:tetratricopeptide (TPR) repeat protein